jgi:hypothetical protein
MDSYTGGTAATVYDTNDGNTSTGNSSGSGNDYYLHLDDHTTETGVINSVIIRTYVRRDSGAWGGDPTFTIGVKTNGSSYFSGSTNPQSTSAWTWDEIDSLVAIINHTNNEEMRATELYAEVNYSPNVAPTLNIDEPDGTSDTVTVGDNYSIQYDLADTDDTVTVAFYYDTNNSGLNGTAITGACATAAEGTNVTCTWDTTGMTLGTYYVYGIANDGTNPDVAAYSSGEIGIYNPPVLNIDEPDGTGDAVAEGANYSIQYDLADPDDVVTVAFYYDTDSSGLDGTAITGACATAAEGTNATCTWDTTGMTAGSYYVYGIADDGTAPQVSDYSPGQIRINDPPTLNVDEPDGASDNVAEGSNYSIQYDLADTDDVVTVAFYYDTDSSGLDGTAITGACATAAEGTDATCTWDTTGVADGTYYVYGIADDGIDPQVSDYSSGQITIDGTAPADITNLYTGGHRDSWILLYWTAPGDDGSSGTATTYDIRYRTDAAITSGNWATATTVTGEPSPSVAGTLENFTVTDLSPGTTYYFAIKTADEVSNWSGVSNSPSNSTDSDITAPADITDLATGTVTDSSVLLTWTAPGDSGMIGTATTYDIRYSTSTITAGNWGSATQASSEPSPSAAGTSESFNVTSLSPQRERPLQCA